jgi:hypothetical protein
MAIRPADPFGSYLAGRQARQDEEYGNTRNKLAQLEAEQYPQQVAQRNRLAGLQETGMQQQQDARAQESKQQAYQQIGALAQQALQSGDPRSFVANALNNPAYAQLFQQAQVDPRQIDLNSPTFDKDLAAWATFGGQGSGPLSAQGKIGADVRGGYLTEEQGNAALNPGMNDYQRQRLELERQKLNQPRQQDAGPLVQVAGPDGNPVYATRDEAVGKPAYVARDKPAAADVKLQNDARMKMPRVAALGRQLSRVEAASQAIAKNIAFDGGEADKYIIDRTEEGRELVAAIAQLRPTITALTRVPGIGSQSDLEARLDGLQFPTSEMPPEVRQRSLEELKAFSADLVDVYKSILGGQGPAEQQQVAAAAPRRVKVDAQGNVIGN